jgi:hypothetical protein
MPIDPDQPGGSHDPTRAQDPIDPTRAQDPVDPTRVQPGVDSTRIGDDAYARPDSRRAPVVEEPRRRDPGSDHDRTGGWWLWALLAAVLIAIVLFALFQAGDDDDAVGTADQAETDAGAVETAPEDTAAETTATTAPADDAEVTTTEATPNDGGAIPPDDGAAESGTITATDGTELLTLLEGDASDAERLAPYAGETLTGARVEVLEIVDGEGFWIGTDDQQRLFAHGTEAVTVDVEVGQRIDFSGVLTPNPSDGATDAHDLSDDAVAELYDQQGHHLELGSITAP